MDHLSPELILAFFEVFPLKTLIAAQGVNKQWRSLVPKTTMLPARRKLYDLYHVAIVSPAFLANRAVLVQKLVPFDRSAFLATLEVHGRTLPDEFRCWILEWPAKAVIGWTWPGLDPYFNMGNEMWKPYGSNSLSAEDRQGIEPMFFCYPPDGNPYPAETEKNEWGIDLETVDLPDWDAHLQIVLVGGMHIWYHGCTVYTILIADKTKPLLHGTVHTLDGQFIHGEACLVASDWIQWLRKELEKMDENMRVQQQ